MGNIALKFWKLAGRILRLLFYIYPRIKHIWAFGSYDNTFSDNAKYLFLYISNCVPDIDAVWITGSEETYEYVTDLGYHVEKRWSLKGILRVLSAKTIIFNANIADVNYWLSGGAILVNLWHGVSLKKIEFDLVFRTDHFLSSLYRKVFAPLIELRPDVLLAPSDEIAKNFQSAFRVGEDRIFIGEYPRNDIFFQKHISDGTKGVLSPGSDIIIDAVREKKRTLIYLPTFRDNTIDFIVDSDIDFQVFNKQLQDRDEILLVKFHHMTKIWDRFSTDLSNVILLDSTMDIYPILPHTDLLITDYSSVFFDYSLLNKKMVFYAYDLELYIQKYRELYFDYSSIVPGRIVYSFRELLEAVKEELTCEEEDKIKSLNEKCWISAEGEGSRRLTEYLKCKAERS